MAVNTKYGMHDGDSWEEFCHMCLSMRFTESYIKVPADPGDYGIDSFNSDGTVYQCYCPERDYTTSELNTKIRDKITVDLKKLRTYESEIKNLFGSKKIAKWILLTPQYSKNSIIAHCTSKTEEVKEWNLEIISSQFEVRIADIDFFSAEAITALSSLGYYEHDGAIKRKIEFHVDAIGSEMVEQFKQEQSKASLIETLRNKHYARFPQDGRDYRSRISEQVDSSITNFITGEEIVAKWIYSNADHYEKFVRLQSTMEGIVAEKCSSPLETSNETLFKEIKQLVEDMLREEFVELGINTRVKLGQYVIAEWLVRCPLKFEAI